MERLDRYMERTYLGHVVVVRNKRIDSLNGKEAFIDRAVLRIGVKNIRGHHSC